MQAKTRILSRLRRHWLACLACAIVALLAADLIIGAVYRSRMAAIIAGMGGNELHSRVAIYLPPHGVMLLWARLRHRAADGSSIEWFGASRVTLRLAWVPHGEGERTLGLRELSIRNGSFVRQAGADDAMVIDRINALVTPAADSSGNFRVLVQTDPNARSTIHCAAVLNSDEMRLDVSEMAIRADLSAALAQLPMGQSIQRSFRAFNVNGTLNVRGTASLPFHDLHAARYDADVQLRSVTARFPDDTSIDRADVQIDLHGDSGLSGARAVLRKINVISGKTTFDIESAALATADDGKSWKLTDLLGRLDIGPGVPDLDCVHLAGRFILSGWANGPMEGLTAANAMSAIEHEISFHPRDVSIQPPKYPIPIQHISGGPIVCRAGLVRFDHLLGDYGGDKVVLDSAHITLDDRRQGIKLADLMDHVRIDGMAGSLICHQPGPEYPATLGKTVAQLRPGGKFAISGWYIINCRLPDEQAKPKPDFFFRISTADGAFALTPKRAPITQIRGDATVSAMLVDITEFRGRTLGGTVLATGKITPVRPIQYTGSATFYNMNLKTACDLLGYAPQTPIVGEVYLKTSIAGEGPGGPRPALATLAADGEFDLANGNFGDITTIRQAAEHVSKPDQPLDGEAAGVFKLRDEKITLDNCAVGNQTFGLQGSGTIGFDKSLDLHAVAAPLGDWQMSLRKSNVPVIEDVGSDIAGAIQRLFAGAQQALLWDIQISGTTTNPKVTQVPAPVISKGAAAIFGQLIRGGKDAQLIDQLREKKK